MQSAPLLQQRSLVHVKHGAFFTMDSRKACKANHLRASAATLVTTPHSGYHFDNTTRNFFEGWYFKVRASLHTWGMPYSLSINGGFHLCGTSVKIRAKSYRSQVTLPGEGNAFAFIYSVEDPGGGGENGGVGAQVMHHF